MDKQQKKQERKMGRILTKAWNIENSEEFQEYLRNVGEKLDKGAYKGREGWHKFASDLGNVYSNHPNRYVCLYFFKAKL